MITDNPLINDILYILPKEGMNIDDLWNCIDTGTRHTRDVFDAAICDLLTPPADITVMNDWVTRRPEGVVKMAPDCRK